MIELTAKRPGHDDVVAKAVGEAHARLAEWRSTLEDLRRLHQHLLDRAETAEDLDQAEIARSAVLASLRQLERAPFLYRKVGESAFLRELVVPFGGSGYVLLYEVIDAVHVDVLALRHQV